MSTTRADSAAFHGVPTTTARISSAASRESGRRGRAIVASNAARKPSPATSRLRRGSRSASGPNTTVPTRAGRNVNAYTAAVANPEWVRSKTSTDRATRAIWSPSSDWMSASQSSRNSRCRNKPANPAADFPAAAGSEPSARCTITKST